MNKGWIKMSHFYLSYFPRNKPSKSVTVHFIVFNDSAGPKMFIKMYLNFSDFFTFQSCLNVIEATHIWLIIGTLFVSLTRNFLSFKALFRHILNILNYKSLKTVPFFLYVIRVFITAIKPLFDYIQQCLQFFAQYRNCWPHQFLE